ncbi:unnamed protein product [Schistosoma mattheei]|uniref:Uncharacterized protein n=1 Tax=Schistosoma mattheei TaxID=31246 RepID=A0A183Q336_9TREM|nr:unnamed protein product [Schistosoma mattheei]
MKQLHDTTKKLAGKYSKPERPVKDKEDRPITEIQQQRNRSRGITLLSVPGKVLNRVLLNRMKDAVDAQLRDQQAGFRKDRS